MSDKISIAVIGLLSAGKTTFVDKLSKKTNFKPFYEKVESNELLELFYNDMKRYSFTLETYLLYDRIKQFETEIKDNKLTIFDKSVYEDIVFAKTLHDNKLMSDIEYKIYKGLYLTLINKMEKPDYIIYLKVSPETSLKRIKKRGRPMEQTITIDYLNKLNIYYEKLIEKLSKINGIKVITINRESFDNIYTFPFLDKPIEL